MPDLSPLAFSVIYALTHKTDGAARKFMRSLSDAEIDRLGEVVAEHLRLCGWQRVPNR